MGQVTVTLNGRTYRLRCGDGEEPRLRELADHVGQRVEHLALQFGQFGDERLLLVAALLITDEMFDLKGRLDATADASDATEPVADPTPTLDHTALHPPEDVSHQETPVEPVAPTATSASSEKTAPRLRRGSLEARLAQARSGATTDTGS